MIAPSDLPERVRRAGARRGNGNGNGTRGASPSPPFTLAELERRAIREAIERRAGNLTEAAEELGIGRSTLYRKLREEQAEAAAREAAPEPVPDRR
ncbi:MAG: helix-turn-helix domain-containing protein [Thermoanaerobaculia bacterium]|nr:helix-turn-helix domain-containing protein [Thermoanaerobaculia bacterium]